MKPYILISILLVLTILTIVVYYVFFRKVATYVSEQEAPYKFYNNTTLGDEAIVGVDVSKDGKYITLVQENDFINVSNDGGQTFQEKNQLFNNTQSGMKNWSCIGMSNDGKYQVTCDKDDQGSLWYSMDYGDTWSPIGSLNNNSDKKGWLYICISGAGNKIFAISSEGTSKEGKIYLITLNNNDPSSPTYTELSNDPRTIREWKYVKTGYNGHAVIATTSNLVYHFTFDPLNNNNTWKFTELTTDERNVDSKLLQEDPDIDIRREYSKFDLNITGCAISGEEIGDNKHIYITDDNSLSVGEDQVGMCINLTPKQNYFLTMDYFSRKPENFSGVALSHYGYLITSSSEQGTSTIVGKKFYIFTADDAAAAAQLPSCKTPIKTGYSFSSVCISRDKDDINNDGKYMLLGTTTGDLLMSKDFGETWEIISQKV
jgi:hypothetical protein